MGGPEHQVLPVEVPDAVDPARWSAHFELISLRLLAARCSCNCVRASAVVIKKCDEFGKQYGRLLAPALALLPFGLVIHVHVCMLDCYILPPVYSQY